VDEAKLVKGTNGIMQRDVGRIRIDIVELIKKGKKLPHLMVEGRCSLLLSPFLDPPGLSQLGFVKGADSGVLKK
jgi:hypothetical protein